MYQHSYIRTICMGAQTLRSAVAKTSRSLSVVPTIPSESSKNTTVNANVVSGKNLDDLLYHHFMKPFEKVKGEKFASPRKRASKIFAEINKEEYDKNIMNRPNILQVPFRVGDAIEITMVAQGGAKSSDLEKIRGVVLGKVNRGLGSSVDIRDVVFGEPINRKIVLHSPLVRSIKVLEENFVFKGRRKVKRAKLYYLRDRLPEETRVTKW